MKKIFTLAAAVLASFSLMAAAPDFESFNWGEDDFATVFADHDGLVISSDASAWKGNFGGTQYVTLGGGTDLSADSPTPYFGVSAEAGIDSIEIYWAPNGGDASNVAWAAWEDASNFLAQDIDFKGEGAEYTGSKSIEGATWQMFDFSATDEHAIMFARQIKKAKMGGENVSNYGKNKTINILGVRVWLHESKSIVSTVETLTGVSANGVAMSADEFSNLLLWHNAGFPDEEFAAAPTFVFYRNTVITYEDESTKETNDSIEVVGVEDEMGDWAASATIGGVEYSVYAGKAVSVTITYMDGETLLGTEVIAEADLAKDYVNYESKPLATFLGWFSDAECTTPVDLVNMPVYTDITVYAKFEKAYASSLNIEQYILDNGMHNTDKDHIGEAFAAVLNSVHYAYENINALDSLNDDPSKTNRNYAFLGLKIKNTNGYMACWLQAGHTINVRFGNVGGDFKVAVNGVEQTLTAADYANTSVESANVLSFTADEDALLEIKGSAGNKTLVIKQIMIDEPIADVVLPDPLPTGINNTEEAVKTAKVIRNGQLFIEKNGVLYNAQGARL